MKKAAATIMIEETLKDNPTMSHAELCVLCLAQADFEETNGNTNIAEGLRRNAHRFLEMSEGR